MLRFLSRVLGGAPIFVTRVRGVAPKFVTAKPGILTPLHIIVEYSLSIFWGHIPNFNIFGKSGMGVK